MNQGKHVHRRRRRSRPRFHALFPLPALLLIGVMIAAALSPHVSPADAAGDVQADRLAGQLADSAAALNTPPLEGSVPSVSVPEWVTQNLLPLNEYSRPGTALDAVHGVVVHYTGNPGTTAEQNRSYFNSLAQTHETYASSHFVIGMDGTVIQCVPLDEVAYCSSSRNHDTISIECCHKDASGEFSRETLESLTQLLDWLIASYDLDREDILRHYDVTGKECPYYYVKHPDAWTALLDGLTF